MRLLLSILAGLGAFVVFSVLFTPLGGLPAAVIVAYKEYAARGGDARARWFVGNFMVTGVCTGFVFLVPAGIAGALLSFNPFLGGLGFLGAIGAAVYAWITTWGESQPPETAWSEPLAPPSAIEQPV